MLIRKPGEFRYSDVTPREVYLRRREFIRSASGLAVGAAGALAVPPWLAGLSAQRGQKLPGVKPSPLSTRDEKVNSYDDITTYNNFYEFGTDKDDPAKNAPGRLKTNPWKLTVEGEVTKKLELGYEDLFTIAPLEERIYRMRCVEAWSIVVPWVGVPLSALLKKVEPTSKAKYVAFESLYERGRMLRSEEAGIDFPYVEGLRLDEAMHPLTILAVGLYGEKLPEQNGAPVRLVVPWKYGFKGIKSIVRIRLVEREPPATWNIANSREYGFYSNVNPEVDHPRWSQASERRLGEFFRRKTQMFNGYADQVASLYTGMDLRKLY
ncbi:MAG: protein-methionine-sulfoxide reductase catalytic subunit MsrP [Acidimicrobiia bacterium]|nr:protein-methionine-sulfoxide reductase catalytic subunit MsrP [Acidimicrobiia bacterium]